MAAVYWLAYESACKGVTVYRDRCKALQVLMTNSTKDKIDGVATESTPTTSDVQVPAATRLGTIVPMDRPTELTGRTIRKKTGLGDLYLTINEIDGKQFEIFATIGRTGKSITAKAESVGRLSSLALRSGVAVSEIVKQLKGICGEHPTMSQSGTVLSIPDAIGGILEDIYLTGKDDYVVTTTKFITDEGDGNACPVCGSSLIMQEGCSKCSSGCGYSKCG